MKVVLCWSGLHIRQDCDTNDFDEEATNEFYLDLIDAPTGKEALVWIKEHGEVVVGS